MRAFILSLAFWSSLNLWGAAQAPAPSATPPPKPFDCSAPEHRQFDFWLGEWDVVPNAPSTASSAPSAALGGSASSAAAPASNIITKLDGGCVIQESWDAGTQTGHSFNIYDRATRQWHQTWVDSNGGLHQYWGGLKDGNMVFQGEVPLGPGSRFAGRRTVRLTFFPQGPDKVRQFSEALNMDGTWSVNYDLIYTRRARPK